MTLRISTAPSHGKQNICVCLKPHTYPNYCRKPKRFYLLAKYIRLHYSDNSLQGFNVLAEHEVLTNLI